MRIHVAHRTDYRYDPPAAGVIQVLRATPRNHEGQYLVRWRIDVSPDVREELLRRMPALRHSDVVPRGDYDESGPVTPARERASGTHRDK